MSARQINAYGAAMYASGRFFGAGVGWFAFAESVFAGTFMFAWLEGWDWLTNRGTYARAAR